MATGVSIPLRGLEGIPGLPGASQDEAVRTRKFEMSHGVGATCRSTSISRSTLEKNPLHGHLFEGNPVDEGTKRRVTDTPMHHSVKAPHPALHQKQQQFFPFLFVTVVLCVVVFILYQSLSNFLIYVLFPTLLTLLKFHNSVVEFVLCLLRTEM